MVKKSARAPKNADLEFRFVTARNSKLSPWANLMRDFWLAELTKETFLTKPYYLTGFFRFAFSYLDGQGLVDQSPEAFFAIDRALPPLLQGMELSSRVNGAFIHDVVVDFLDWVLRNRLAVEDEDGHMVVPPHLAMPFRRIKIKSHDKGDDLDFWHLLKLDPRLEDWRALAAEWLKDQIGSVAWKRHALDKFLIPYLHDQRLERNFGQFLLRETPKPEFMEVLLGSKSKGSDAKSKGDIRTNNEISSFIDWVLASKLGDERGEWDHTLFHNPIPKLTKVGMAVATESNKAVLSIRYIKECRELLAEGATFRDWTWAHTVIPTNGSGGDWFVVEPERVDHTDPDCVWRERKASKRERRVWGYPATVIELWSPIRFVALYVKLELPLRLVQARMLDSGEADTYRYVRDITSGGHFVLNQGPHAIGDPKRPYMRGVFHRSGADQDAGLYINTNKTADIGKSENDKGYVIPWTHEQVLYWLAKLRDWQAKYNPLQTPAKWTDLTSQHLGGTPPHPSVMAQRGTACFLFRDPCAKRPDLPISSGSVDTAWHRLLSRLEANCAARGDLMANGEPLAFVVPAPGETTYFPLHALRVSLLSYLVLDLKLPLPIVSKLIAGHATIIMTLYYTKLGHTQMAEIFEEAERRTFEAEQQNHRHFLKDASYNDIRMRFASLSDDAPRAAAGTPAAGLTFEDRGICPVGGGKCNEGGERLIQRKTEATYGPVPGYPRERNCVRCRFFLTGPAFLPGLIAHFNAVSERAHRASALWHELEQRQHEMEQERHDCEQLGKPFIHSLEIERHDQRTQEAEEACSRLMNDMQATYHLIQRSIEIQNAAESSEGVKLVASGAIHDISTGLLEATSELHQLEVVCQNAEIYINPEATPAVLRRAQLIDRMLMFNRMPPVLMHLDEKSQLQMGNALMQLIKARTGSIEGSLPYAECQKKLSDLGIRPKDLECEMTRIVGGSKTQQLIQQANVLSVADLTDRT